MRGINSENFYMGLGELYLAEGRVAENELLHEENRVGRLLGEIKIEYRRRLHGITDEYGNVVCVLTAEAPVSISGTILTDCDGVFALFMPGRVGDIAPIVSAAYADESGIRYICGTVSSNLPLTFGKVTPLGIPFTISETNGTGEAS